MRKLLAAAVPAIVLLAAAAPGQAQTRGSNSWNEAVAAGTVDTGARNVTLSADMVGKTVRHRHGGPVAGTIQSLTTDSAGQPVAVMSVRGASQPVMLGADHFERRGNQLVVLHDAGELQQMAQYSGLADTGFGSSSLTTPPMGSGADR